MQVPRLAAALIAILAAGCLDVPDATTGPDVPDGSAGCAAADLFDRANADDLGSSWITNGGMGFRIDGDAAQTVEAADGSIDTAAHYDFDTPCSEDQWSEVVIGATTATGSAGFGVVLRADPAGAIVYYRVVGNRDGWSIGLYDGSDAPTPDELDTGDEPFDAGDRLYAEIAGSTLTVKKNDAILRAIQVDAPLSGGLPGIVYSSAAPGSLDSWRGGDL